MRKIGIKEVEGIALGASLLSAGGGWDPYYGKLMAIGAIREQGPVELISPEEVPGEAVIMPIAMMGAPTVLCEKGTNGNEYRVIYDMVSQYLGKPIYAVMPMEAGEVNSMLPIAAAAQLGLPMVDCDGMGRAFPELQMVTFTIGGVSATPMALTDEKGNSVIFNTITNKWTEELARAVTVSCGGSVTVALYIMAGNLMKAYGVKGIVTRSEQVGRAIREVKNASDCTPEEAFLRSSEGFRLFRGKVADMQRETNGASYLSRMMKNAVVIDVGGTTTDFGMIQNEFPRESSAAAVIGGVRTNFRMPDIISIGLGGGSIILPKTLAGTGRVYAPGHFGCANAMGSVISKVSGSFEQLMDYDQIPREQALEQAKAGAIKPAVEAGAVEDTVEIIEAEDVPLAYCVGNTCRVWVKAAGDLA